VESAIRAAKKTLIHDHIDHCLGEAADGRAARASIEEFKTVSKYL
jgi:DNA-binding FrmR family transcriptional regulator